jgi:hypothetical protein
LATLTFVRDSYLIRTRIWSKQTLGIVVKSGELT